MAAESELWGQCKEYVRRTYSGKLKKVEASGDNGFPDGIVLLPGLPPIFAEFKSVGGRYRKRQLVWRKWLIESGYSYLKVDDVFQFTEATNKLELEARWRPKTALEGVERCLRSGDDKYGIQTRYDGDESRHMLGAIRHAFNFFTGNVIDNDSGEHAVDHLIARLLLYRETQLRRERP